LEVGEIYNQMFELKYDKISKGEEKPKKSVLDALNKLGLSAIDYFEKVIQSVVGGTNKEALENAETLNTIITAKFNVARLYSRLTSKEVKENVNTLSRSLEAYRWIKKFISEQIAAKGALSYEMKETLKNCEEMVELLPAKIDRINYGAN